MTMTKTTTPARARHACSHCGAPLALDAHPYTELGPGRRAYRCGLCSHVTAFYSAEWLSPTRWRAPLALVIS